MACCCRVRARGPLASPGAAFPVRQEAGRPPLWSPGEAEDGRHAPDPPPPRLTGAGGPGSCRDWHQLVGATGPPAAALGLSRI